MRKQGIGFLAILVTYLTGCESPQDDFARLGTENFNQDVWSISVSSRPYMLHDLIDSYALVGMKATNVKALLGQSDSFYERDDVPAYFIKADYSCLVAMPVDAQSLQVQQVIILPKGCL
ncbi:hypothetical protein ACKC9G_14795 [Pokkaliibacter sp. CJK22405]|uniref:hypothetical protein n=1 Tax=Pokkaliibacter sp. CJK22405 TaxID=3384615 RepID=UPI003984F613